MERRQGGRLMMQVVRMQNFRNISPMSDVGLVRCLFARLYFYPQQRAEQRAAESPRPGLTRVG